MHTSPLLVLLGTLPLSVPPQQPFIPWDNGPASPCVPFAPDNTIEWPSDPAYGTPAGFGRTVLADLDGDQSADAVVVVDGVPVALWKVAVYDALEPIDFPTQPAPTDVRGIAALPGGAPSGRDALVLTDERGLYLVSYANWAFEDPQILDASLWVDAAPIRADDLDGDQDLDLIGVAADGRTILTLRATPSGFEPGLAVYASRPTTDVVAVEWDAAFPGRELVLLTNRGLVILRSDTGAQIGSVLWPSGPGAITRFRASGTAGDELLAWSRVSGPSTSELVVRNALLSQGPWPLAFDFCGTYGSLTPIALMAGDYDGQGGDGLLLVHEGSDTAVMLANQGPGGHFDPSDPLAHDVVPLAALPAVPGDVGLPAFGQVDGEDFDDIVFPVATTGTVEVFRMLPFETGAVPGQSSMVVVSEHTEFGPISLSEADNHLRLGFGVPNKYAAFTSVDLIVWEQLSVEWPVELDAIYHKRHALETNGGNSVSPPTQWIDIEHVFPAFGPGGGCWADGQPPSKPLYYTELRFVRYADTAEEIRSPVYIGGFTLETCELGESETDHGYLLQRGIQGKEFDLLEHHGLTPGPGTSEQVLGLYVPMSAQPPFELGANPSPGPRSPGNPAWPFTEQ